MISDQATSGVGYLEIACGENEKAALDYLRHYRSPHMIALDADYALSRAYKSQSWPRFVVVDAHGIVRYHDFPTDGELTQLRACLRGLLSTNTPPSEDGWHVEGGIAFPGPVHAARQARRDRFPRLALDRHGRPRVVFTSNRTGANAVYWRQIDLSGQPRDELLSAGLLEGYAPDCAWDASGTFWVVWCGAQSNRYDIYVHSRPENGPGRTVALSHSADDAMSARLAIGPKGAVTVTYYQWRPLRGVSRDRDVFARTYDPATQTWDAEREVSPHEPQVEDHTDPDVAYGPDGLPWVAWSYDYHPSLFKQPLPVDQPTIFAAKLGLARVADPLLVGSQFPDGHAIDLFPSVATDGEGVLWCAWDASQPRRCIKLARLTQDQSRFEWVGDFGGPGRIASTPELAPVGGNSLLLAWSEKTQGRWQAQVVLLRAGKAVARATIADTGEVLYPQAQGDAAGRYWLVYERTEEQGSEVVLKPLTAELRVQP